MPRSVAIYCFTQRLEVIVLKAFVYFTGFCESRLRLGALIDKLLLSILLFGIKANLGIFDCCMGGWLFLFG